MPSWENTPAIERTCTVCNEPFSAKRDGAKYCSPLCANRARRSSERRGAAEQRKAWRENRLKQPGYRERVNLTANENRKLVKQWLADLWLADFKTSAGYIDCGYTAHHAALDIDHMEGHSPASTSS